MSMLGLNADEQGPGSLGEVSNVREPHWFSFTGRIGRPAYWGRSVLAYIGFQSIVAAGENARDPSIFVIALLIALLGASLWLTLATGAKRWHDMGHSGWLVLVSLIFTPAWIVVGFFQGDEGSNEYGADPRSARTEQRNKAV